MTKSRERKATIVKYYEVEPSLSSSFYSSWEFTNWDRLQSDTKGPLPKTWWPDGLNAITRGPWTIPDYVEAPHFVIAKKKANALSDFGIIDGFMFISEKLKTIIDDLAPNSCEFRPCTTEFTDNMPGPKIWLCSVTKVFRDAVDLSKSRIGITGNGRYSFLEYQFSGGSNLVFRKKKIQSDHLFQLTECAPKYFCDESFKQTCKAAKIRGLAFKPIGELAE